MKIIINGAGIAGPTLAWWLRHYGFEPTLVEEAPALRKGGYVIDFWGVGYDIAEKMGLMPVIDRAGYRMQELRLVGDHGQRLGAFQAKSCGTSPTGVTSASHGAISPPRSWTDPRQGGDHFLRQRRRHRAALEGRPRHLRAQRPARLRSGHRRGWAAFGGAPAGFRAAGAVRAASRL